MMSYLDDDLGVFPILDGYLEDLTVLGPYQYLLSLPTHTSHTQP